MLLRITGALALTAAFAGCLFGIAAAAKVLASDRFASARLWGAARLETLPPVAPDPTKAVVALKWAMRAVEAR